jgi:hypothetical protein
VQLLHSEVTRAKPFRVPASSLLLKDTEHPLTHVPRVHAPCHMHMVVIRAAPTVSEQIHSAKPIIMYNDSCCVEQRFYMTVVYNNNGEAAAAQSSTS